MEENKLTAQAVLVKHLDKNKVVIGKQFVGYLYDAMQEYADQQTQELRDENEKWKKKTAEALHEFNDSDMAYDDACTQIAMLQNDLDKLQSAADKMAEDLEKILRDCYESSNKNMSYIIKIAERRLLEYNKLKSK